MNREVCEHFNPVDLPCAKCVEKRKSEAAFLADELEAPLNTIIGAELHRRAAAELRRLHAENASLAAALASSCDEQRHELWESGGIAGCERARVAERQRDALLEALRALVHNEGLDAYSYLDKGIGTATAAGQRWLNARAAIKAVEEGK